MTSAISNKLDTLVVAFESKGLKVANSLLPGLDRKTIAVSTTWFPVQLPEEIYQLYEWRNGQAGDAWEEKFPFWFRDNAFCSISNAKAVYESTVAIYAEYNDPARDGVNLLECFPFAEFNGECFLLLCSPTLQASHVVISLGGDLVFVSVEKMAILAST